MKQIGLRAAAVVCSILIVPALAAAQTAPAIPPSINTPDKVESSIGTLHTTVYFGPSKPAGVNDGNWIQTVSGKGWSTLLRLYSPLEPFFTKAWRPSEIEPVR